MVHIISLSVAFNRRRWLAKGRLIMTQKRCWNIIKRKAVSWDWGSAITGLEFGAVGCDDDHHPLQNLMIVWSWWIFLTQEIINKYIGKSECYWDLSQNDIKLIFICIIRNTKIIWIPTQVTFFYLKFLSQLYRSYQLGTLTIPRTTLWQSAHFGKKHFARVVTTE